MRLHRCSRWFLSGSYLLLTLILIYLGLAIAVLKGRAVLLQLPLAIELVLLDELGPRNPGEALIKIFQKTLASR